MNVTAVSCFKFLCVMKGANLSDNLAVGLMMSMFQWLLTGISTCWKWILIGWGDW